MSRTTKVTEKGQTTIPHELREKHGIEPGDEVIWEETEDGIVMRKKVSDSGRGMLVPEGTSKEKREAVAEELSEQIRESRENDWAI